MIESTTQPPVKKGFHIPSLDGIRAVSFMLVFVAHCGLEHIIPGGLGVTVFFFLSGYLITTLLRTEVTKTGGINLRDFYMRRILRILPPFYITLLLAVLLHLVGVFPNTLELKALAYQFLHIGNYWTVYHSLDGIPRGTNVLWSLAVEEHFYLIFPVLYIAMQSRLSVRRQTAVLVMICMAMMAWRLVLIHYFKFGTTYGANNRTFCASDTRGDSILWGCIMAIACNPMLDKPFATGKRLGVWLAIAASVMIFSLLYRNGEFRETYRYTLHGMAMIPIFTALIVWHQSPVISWLNWKPIRKLGVLSYSLYLVHYTIIYVVWERLKLDFLGTGARRSIAQGLIAFALSLMVAQLYFQLIEKPFAKMRKKFSPGSSSGKSGGQSGDKNESAKTDFVQPTRKMAI